MTYIYKPLTKAEKRFNKRNPQHAIKPYIAFYIDEVEYPEEAKLWKILGYENIRQFFVDLNSKKEIK